MNSDLIELDCRKTPLGELILRRRRTTRGDLVYEVKLDGSFLMSSVVNASEIALADLAIAELGGPSLDILVGGLGLGHTAHAALQHRGVRSVLVVEYLEEVIRWHRDGLVPLGESLTLDERYRVVHGDFFAMSNDPAGFDPCEPQRLFDGILVDIDHSPDSNLHPSHVPFYSQEGLGRVADRLKLGGIFALWSADPPDVTMTARLGEAFCSAEARPVEFRNPLLDRDDVNTIYLARKTGNI